MNRRTHLVQLCLFLRYKTMPDSNTWGKDYKDAFLWYLSCLRRAYAPIPHLFCLCFEGDILLCASNSLALSPELQDYIKVILIQFLTGDVKCIRANKYRFYRCVAIDDNVVSVRNK